MPLTIRRRLVDRVRQWRKVAYVGCSALVVLAAAAVFVSISTPSATVEMATGPAFFDANRAFRLAEELVRLYPLRVPGTEDAAGATNWYADKLEQLNIPSETSEFAVPLGDTDLTLRNVSVVLPGTSRDSVLVVAPRRSAETPEADPLGYASATAILADLVQVFAARPHERTLIFLSTEDGGLGAVGLGQFLDTHPAADEVDCILVLEGLGRPGPRDIRAGVSGPRGTTPGWYIQLAGRVFADQDVGVKIPGLVGQAAANALALYRGDQAAGLSRGIPSLLLFDDGPESPVPAGFDTQGAAIEQLILSLASGTQLPSDPGTALLLPTGRYLTNRAITILGAMMLLPSLVVIPIWLLAARLTMGPWLRYLRNLFSFAVPFAATLGVALLLSRTPLIPRYSAQVPLLAGPATEPRWVAPLILLGAGTGLLLASRHFLGYLRPKEPRAVAEMAKLTTGLLCLAAAMAVALSRSPFMLLAYLVAAWTWPLATCLSEPPRADGMFRFRFVSNAPLLLCGLLAPLLLYGYLASQGAGWLRAWWFLLVQMVSGAYGVRGPAALVLVLSGLMALVGVKRLRVVPIETLEADDELSLLEPPRRRRRL